MSVVLACCGPAPNAERDAWLQAATRFAAYAGPDAQCCRSGETAGLGHAMLHASIERASPQPLTVDDRVWLSADVRLDDRATLLSALAQHGRPLPSDADDARLVLEAYLTWGEECVEHLAGDFAFAIWDDRRRRLFCARDQLGVIPLFYATLGDELYVAGALDALRVHDGVDDALDETTIGDLLVMGCSMDPAATAFAAIRQVPPAHVLIWEGGRTTVRRYWSLPRWEGFARFAKPDDYADHFRTLLREAVADRTRCAHVGVQLSGGLDSTSVAALAHEVSRAGQPSFAMRAYTATLAGVMADREGEYAALVAHALGMEMDWIDVDRCPDVDPIATPEVVTPEPGPYRRTALELEFARRPAQHGRVVLSGLGGDVLLGFQPDHWLTWAEGGEWRRVVTSVTEYVRLFRRLPVPGVRSAFRHRASLPNDDGAPLADWIDAGLARRTTLDERRRAYQRAAKQQDHAPGLATWPAWAALLACGHPGYTGAPVRFRHPFFDLRLLRFVLSLPPRPWLLEKRILREATRGLLPDAVRQRPKTPLAKGPGQALREERGAQAQLEDLIATSPGLDRFVDRAHLLETLRQPSLGDRRLYRQHVAALGLAHWLLHRRRPPTAAVVPHRARQATAEPLAIV